MISIENAHKLAECLQDSDAPFANIDDMAKTIFDWIHENESYLSIVDWNDVPSDEVSARVIIHYYTKNGVPGKTKIIYEEERPNLIPVVEVGQIWEHGVTEILVLGLGKEKDLDTVCFKYLDDDDGLQIEHLSKFVGTFNLVQ